MKRRLFFGVAFLCLLMLSVLSISYAETFSVATQEELSSAFTYANNHPGVPVIIELSDDITINSGLSVVGAKVNLTLLGKGHTIICNGAGFGVRNGAVLNLGANGEETNSALTLDANGSAMYDAIIGIAEYGDSTPATLNMYSGVVLKNNNHTTYGAGNTGRGVHVHGGVFNMYGGTICNNRAVDGQNGGGVALSNDTSASGTPTYAAEMNMHGGSIEGNEADIGGGVFLYNGTTFNMYGGTISNNTGRLGGGGIYLWQKDQVNIEGGEISGNTAPIGGGIYAESSSYNVTNRVYSTDRTVISDDIKAIVNLSNEGKIINNVSTYSSTAGTGGGGIMCGSSIININGGEISGNTTASSGAGISCMSTAGGRSRLNIFDGLIKNNTATNFGGAIYFQGAEIKMSGGEITENTATTYYGGAICSYQPVTISGGSITGNNAGQAGGGVFGFQSITMTDGILCNNIAPEGNDVYAYITNSSFHVNLSSASNMDQEFRTSGFTIDGWYEDDDDGTGTTTWNINKAYQGDKQRFYADTVVNEDAIALIAAFTAYDEIEVTKNWIDYENTFESRPESITFTLFDRTTNNPVLDQNGNAAKITLNASNSTDTKTWIGKISKLPILDLEDTSKYELWEETLDNYLITNVPTITQSSSNEFSYTIAFDNTFKRPLTVYKVWNDENNYDGHRPSSVTVTLGGISLTDMEDNPITTFDVTSSDDWSKTYYLPAKADAADSSEYNGITYSETYDETYYSQELEQKKTPEDGHINIIFINKHKLNVDEARTVDNSHTININYVANKTWVGGPEPEITITLKQNGTKYATGVLEYDGTNWSYTFADVPKYYYTNEEKTEFAPYTYTISEDITDPNWVYVGDNTWYSLDGKGKYVLTAESQVTSADVEGTDEGESITGSFTNTYTDLQTTTQLDVTKIWQDFNDESSSRPDSITLGLFAPDGTEPVGDTVTLTSADAVAGNANAWKGTFTNLPLYEADGVTPITYNDYTVREWNGTAWIVTNTTFTTSGGFTYTFTEE